MLQNSGICAGVLLSFEFDCYRNATFFHLLIPLLASFQFSVCFFRTNLDFRIPYVPCQNVVSLTRRYHSLSTLILSSDLPQYLQLMQLNHIISRTHRNFQGVSDNMRAKSLSFVFGLWSHKTRGLKQNLSRV